MISFNRFWNFILSVALIVSILLGAGSLESCFANRMRHSQNRTLPTNGSFNRHSSNLISQAKKLIDDENNNNTAPHNIDERYRRLGMIISGLLRSPKRSLVAKILPRDEGRQIESLINQGRLSDASKKVHTAILKLEKTVLSHNTKPRSDFRKVSSSNSLFKLNIHNLSIQNQNRFGNILKLMNPVIDSENRKLYITGVKTTFVGIVDLDTDKLIKTYDIGVPGGFLIPDPKTKNIYLFDISQKVLFKFNPDGGKALRVNSLPNYMTMPEKGKFVRFNNHSYKDTGYPFKRGYLQKENGSYGIIEIRNSAGRIVDRIKHGPDALYFSIDQKSGKLYASNTGDGSISVFDLKNNNTKLVDIDIGTSVDEIVLDHKSNDLYILNRLGGSTVFCYQKNTGNFFAIPNENQAGHQGIGMWPSQIVYDTGKLYILSHYGGKVSVLNTNSKNIIAHIDLKLSNKPRTDGISTMVMDRYGQKLYTAFPELAELSVVDARTMKHLRTVSVKGYEMASSGPARIVLAVNGRLNLLYVYLPEIKKLNVYDSQTLFLLNSIGMDIGRTVKILISNPEKNVLYAGNKILDAETLNEIGTYDQGRKVIAYNNVQNKVYLTSMIRIGRGKMVEKVYEYIGSTLTQEWSLSPVFSIPSSFEFDFKNNVFYAGYFETAEVEAFDLINSGVQVRGNNRGDH